MGSIRLSAYSVEPGIQEVGLLLGEESAEALRTMLGAALEKIRSTRAHRGEAEEQRP